MQRITVVQIGLTVALQTLVSIFAPKFVYQKYTLISLTGVFSLSILLKARPMKNRILKTGQKVLYLVGRICAIVGLFVLINNVFVMRTGSRNCPSCSVNTILGIVGASLLLVFYFSVLVFFTAYDYKSYKKTLE